MCREGVLRKGWGGKWLASLQGVQVSVISVLEVGDEQGERSLSSVACFKWNSRSGNFAVEQLYSAALVRNRFQKECHILSSSSPRNCRSATSALHF